VIIETQVKALEALATNLANAKSVREKISSAHNIFATLAECEKLIEKFIVSDIALLSGNANSEERQKVAPPVTRIDADKQNAAVTDPNRFAAMALADIGRELLSDGRTMHGLEIERIAKTGGFKSDAVHFQSYLSVAFKRRGGFENVGKNNWRLNSSIQAEERDRVSVAPVPRKIQLHSWLKGRDGATRDEVLKGSGLPEGSASSILSVEKDLFQKREDGKWYAL
jgi:hypothetical protein